MEVIQTPVFFVNFIHKYETKICDSLFWVFFALFLLDRVINYFYDFPFFVISAIALFPLLIYFSQKNNTNKKQHYFLMFFFIIITVLNSIIYRFSVKNISDLLFVVLFFTSYFFYKKNIKYLKLSTVYLFLILSVSLFSFTFFGVNSNHSRKANYISTSKNDSSLSSKTKSTQVYSNKTTENNESSEWKPKSIHILKKSRVFHQGLFRVSHVASCFFGFLFLFFVYQYQNKKRIIDLILVFILLGLCIYTGSKTILIAFAFSAILFLFIRKSIIYPILAILFVVLLFYQREYILQITEDTILYPYSVLIYISAENLTAISRFQIWYSWWSEISNFGIIDFLIGKSFANAIIANQQNLNLKIWFHNDFLNIFYTYGLVGFVLYIWFFIKIYRDNRIIIKHNVLIFIFYFSMIFAAFINGFYYYFPVFLLYLFFLMIKTEKQIVK